MTKNEIELLCLLAYIDPGSGFTFLSVSGWIIAALISLFGFLALFIKRLYRFFRKHSKISIALLLLIIAAGLALKGFFPPRKTSSFNEKIIILGFDALSPDIIEPLMEEGKLPNFSRLKNEGSYRRLATTNPALSPVAWAGFATGQNPGKNGIFNFITRDPKTYKLSLSLSKMKNGKPQRILKSKCFWQYTSEKNIPTTILSCPDTFPPDRIFGRMLSGMGVPDLLGTQGTFTFYTTQRAIKTKGTSGHEVYVQKSPLLVMDFIGPRVAGIGDQADYAKVPFKATPKNPDTLLVEYQNTVCALKIGQWSDWQKIEFNLGLFKKAKGIFKFCLVSLEPELQLYMTPINFDPEDPLFPISYPPNYSKELARALGPYSTQGIPEDTWALNEGRISDDIFLNETEKIFDEKKSIFNFELGRFKKGVLFAYFESIDSIQHMFWRYLDPGHPLYDKNAAQKYKNVLEEWIKRLDNILGDVFEKMGQDDTLIVLSDHGFASFRRAMHINTWLRKNGYLELKDPLARQGRRLLEDIDWSKTKAYSIGYSAIFLNQKNREGKGIVNPGEETERLKKEISQKLLKWIDATNGLPVIKKVYKSQEIYSGDRIIDAPDLGIGFNLGYRTSWLTVLGSVPRYPMAKNPRKWSGDHSFDPSLVPGVIFSNKKISNETPSLYSVAPTILKIIGAKEDEIKACDFDGKPLFD